MSLPIVSSSYRIVVVWWGRGTRVAFQDNHIVSLLACARANCRRKMVRPSSPMTVDGASARPTEALGRSEASLLVFLLPSVQMV